MLRWASDNARRAAMRALDAPEPSARLEEATGLDAAALCGRLGVGCFIFHRLAMVWLAIRFWRLVRRGAVSEPALR